MIKFKEKKWEFFYVGLFILTILLYFGKVLGSKGTLFGMDFVLQFYPWKKFIFDQIWSNGTLPFWNPYLFSGIPFVTNMQASMFYPLGFLYYLFPPQSAYLYSTILHFILGIFFMYVFMRTLSISKEGSVVSALIFGFNGFFLGHVYAGHLSFVQNYIWIPIIYLFLYRFVKTRHFGEAVIAGLFLGIQILGGFPQIAFYSIIGVLLFGFFYGTYNIVGASVKEGLKVYIGLMVIVGIGFAISAVQILPTMEFNQLSTRAGGVDYAFATFESLHPKEILTFLLPNVFGNVVDQTYWRSQESWHFWESCGYVGILPLFFIFIKVEDHSIRRLKRYFLLLAVLALFFALGKYNPIYPIVYKLPGFNSFRIPAQIIYLYIFGIAVVSGIGFNRVIEGLWFTNRSFIPFISLIGLVFLFFVTSLNLFPYDLFFHLFRSFAEGPLTQVDMAVLYGRISASFYQGALFFLSISLLFLLLRRNKVHAWVPRFLFPVILMLDLYLFGAEFIKPYEFKTSPEKEKIAETLMGSPSKGRVVTLGEMFRTNDGLQYDFPSILGYDPLIIRRYVYYILSSQNQKPVDHVVNLGRIVRPRAKLLKLLHLKKAAYDDGIVGLHNEIPYAYIVNRAVIKPEDEVLSFMKSVDFDPQKMVILEAPYKSSLSSSTKEMEFDGSFRILEYKNEKIQLQVSTNKPGYLVLSEIYYPGWKAKVDGKKVKVLRGDYIFRAIPLEDGDHEVLLYFVSWPFRIGMCISLFFLIGSSVFIFKDRKKKVISCLSPKRKELTNYNIDGPNHQNPL